MTVYTLVVLPRTSIDKRPAQVTTVRKALAGDKSSDASVKPLPLTCTTSFEDPRTSTATKRTVTQWQWRFNDVVVVKTVWRVERVDGTLMWVVSEFTNRVVKTRTGYPYGSWPGQPKTLRVEK